MKIVSVKNPVWSCSGRIAIDCVVVIEEFGSAELPFRAASSDSEEYGRLLFNELMSGKYGEVADYVPPQFEQQSTPPTPPSNEIPQAVL